jgi:ketosteroid isomerase-like protein
MTAVLGIGCAGPAERGDGAAVADSPDVAAEIETAVWAFHAADTAMDAEAVIDLLWPEFTMLVDGSRTTYDEVATGSREFMANLRFFQAEWTDLQVVPLGPDVAIASFQFRDSIMTSAGELIRARGPTTFVWERRNGEWRLRFADADHYPIAQ